MNQTSAKRHLMICLTVLSALLSVNVQASASDEDSHQTVRAYQLKGNYNIRSEANQESQVMSTLGKTDDVGMKFSHVKGDDKWFKVNLDNGGDGYVNRHALKQVELNGNFVIHSDPSLSSHRVGLVSDTKRPEDLVLTGNQKIVQENGKKIEWLEVMSNGKKAWVAGGAANVQNQKSEVKPAKPIKAKPVPLPPVRPTTKVKTKPAPVVKVAKPAVKPASKSVLAKDLPARPAAAPAKLPAPKAPPVIAQKKAPTVKPELPTHQAPPQEVIASHPVPPAKIPDVADVKPVQPKPAPLKSLECASTKADFAANSRLRAVYGVNYDPFVPWHSWCVNSQPTTGGRWIIDVCLLGQSDSPARQIVPVSICYDFARREAYAMTNGKKSTFNGHDFDHILIGEGARSITIEREHADSTVR